MKKIIYILVILAILGLMFGCGQQKQPVVVDDQVDGSAADTAIEPASQTDAEPTTSPATNPSGAQTSVTQEELDQLKTDLEGMEIEDLEGISS